MACVSVVSCTYYIGIWMGSVASSYGRGYRDGSWIDLLRLSG